MEQLFLSDRLRVPPLCQTPISNTYFILVSFGFSVFMVVVPNSMSDGSDNSGWSKIDSWSELNESCELCKLRELSESYQLTEVS